MGRGNPTTIRLQVINPKFALQRLGYTPHPKGRGYIKYINEKDRFHVYIVKGEIQLHFDKLLKSGHHSSSPSDQLIGEIKKFENFEKFIPINADDICSRFQLNVKQEAVNIIRKKLSDKTFGKLRLKFLRWVLWI